ncbi:Rhodanese domain-containing protein [Favolaschia claudopus]|uniref:M-phase inducer phosphatase n=1 Tax=Favolaschia claudopus TaxID=2862362 RepID=A0AAW0APU6_9AGAR
MSLVDRLTNFSNKRRRISSDMPLFTTRPTQHLDAPVPTTRRHDRLQVSHDVDDLSSDLELSFASNVSLNSPPRDHLALTPESEYPKPMDISPAPPLKSFTRPRAFTSGPRMFGQDRSNESIQSGSIGSLKPESTHSSGKRIQRSALPSQWFTTAARTPDEPQATLSAPLKEAGYPSDDAMDVDTSFEVPSLTVAAPQSAAPTVTGFDALFYETMSPAAPQPKKRRSSSPDQIRRKEQLELSSPGLDSSPSQSKLERLVTGPLFPAVEKPRVEGLGAPSGLKRPRRPAFSTAAQTAYPTLDGESGRFPSPAENLLPPTRRAFSAVISGSPLDAKIAEQSSDESSFEGMSSPAQAYARRQQVKTIRRCDGTDDFRPLTGATALALNESPSAKFLSAGIPGFGDNESAGKLLPCHRVTDDGLMRINPQTLNNLLDGHYREQADYEIIDCRFDYEFYGGHIRGAHNINQTAMLEEHFLRANLKKPKPSVSGDPGRKHILVFHCEFSAKRAPTFAKHLRAKDRALNNHVYPRIHYPEIYILEGGYSQYFQASSVRCEPQAYVTMDDPTHTASRDGGLDQLRKTKFGRHKSYTYGDASAISKASALAQQPKRNTVPAGPGSIFAAATAARTRRGSALTTLAEDGNVTADAEETDEELGDSPCPPPPKGGKKLGRPLVRAETYGPTRTIF